MHNVINGVLGKRKAPVLFLLTSYLIKNDVIVHFNRRLIVVTL